METDELLYHVDADGIGRVVFNRPDARNAFTFAMYDALKEVCASVPTDGSVKALVLTGAGDKAFGAGTDMSQFRAFETAEDAWNYEHRMDGVLNTLEACPVPTIAAINGACTGGGAGIAAACDLRIATHTLKFGFPIARTLGNCLSIANLARLSELMGPARVREVIFTARLVQAEEALAIGLVSELVDDLDALHARADGLAHQLAGHAPLTLRATKEGLRRLRAARAEVDDKDLVAMCYLSRDFKEGLEAFLGKRRPDWRGE